MLTNRTCVQCHSESTQKAYKVRYATRPDVRAKEYARTVEYKSTRPHIRANVQQRREAAKLQRVPPWADLDKIKEVYRLAAESGMTVDHIVPLQGKLVSGLHVHNNLQLLAGHENSSKGNKYVVS